MVIELGDGGLLKEDYESLKERSNGKKRNWKSRTYAASGIANHQHERTVFGKVGGRAFLVERGQTHAVLLKAIYQRPRIGEL